MQTTPLLTGCLVLFLSTGGLAQEISEPSPSAPNTGSGQNFPEEILVIGRQLQDLQQLVYEAEDQVYAIFNEANGGDLYDIHCELEAPLGTRIKNRVCRPNYLREATSQEALGFLFGYTITPPSSVSAYHTPILQKQMEELVRQNRQFFDAIDRHRILREELDAKTRSYFGE